MENSSLSNDKFDTKGILISKSKLGELNNKLNSVNNEISKLRGELKVNSDIITIATNREVRNYKKENYELKELILGLKVEVVVHKTSEHDHIMNTLFNLYKE